MQSPLCRIIMVLGLTATACNAESPSADSPDGGYTDTDCVQTLNGSGEPAFGQTNSRFTLTGDATYLEFTGALFGGPAIASLEESDREGQCRLLAPKVTFCDPPCEYYELCVDDACMPWPSTVSGGTLTLIGVGGSPLHIEPDPDPHEYWQYHWSTEAMGVLDVAAIHIDAQGDEVDSFALETCVVEPPKPIGDWSAVMGGRSVGEDVALTWSNPFDTARVHVRMTTDIGAHGGLAPEIECEGRDTGSLTLPGAFLDLFYDAQYWRGGGEGGDNRLARYHATETPVGTMTVQLRTGSPVHWYYMPLAPESLP